jgi:nicotinate-nucleotide--dimethylbenzimidazole phosphoribosyltransferase
LATEKTEGDDMTAAMHDKRSIPVVEGAWLTRARAHLDTLTKPLGSLGRLEELAARIVAIQESTSPSVDRKAVYIFAADHGVTAEGVSAYPSAVTEQMVLNFLRGGAAINVLARAANAEVHVVDVGVDAQIESPGLKLRKVRRGTRNFLHEAALSAEEVQTALQVGAELAEEAHAREMQLVALGEMGIGNTTSASAITAALTGRAAAHVTGMGTGVSPATFDRKMSVVDGAMALHFPDCIDQRSAPLDVLRCVGGLEIAAMCGFILTAARHRIAVVLDGFISTSAAALAFSFQPAVHGYLFAGHLSKERGHHYLLEFVGLRPILDMDMRLGEGSGAALAFHVIESAVRIYNEMATFESAGVSGAI